MTSLQPMSDARQRQLLKCAEVVIGLVNGGADPTRAMTKVAADAELNSHEIDRVSTKINQALTLAQIQGKAESERAGPFPLTNADKVRAELFGKKQEESDSAERAGDQPSGQQIQGKEPGLKGPKTTPTTVTRPTRNDSPVKAASDDYLEPCEFRFKAPDLLAAIPRPAKVAADLPTVVRAPKLSPAKVAYEIAREEALRAQLHADTCLSAAIQPFTVMYGPSFGAVEKVAAEQGVETDVFDLVFASGELSRSHYRAAHSTAKVAGDVSDYVRRFQALDRALKVAAETVLARDEALKSYQAAQRALSEFKIAADESPALAQVGFDKSYESAKGVMDSALGVEGQEGGVEGAMTDAFGGPAGESKDHPHQSLADKDLEQGVRNNSVRGTYMTAMNDPFIAGHPPAKVIEAINRASSFGLSEPELLSYVKQDLATEGGVPLDLQLRAIQAHRDGSKGA